MLTHSGEGVEDELTDLATAPVPDAAPGGRRLALSGGLWSAASQVLPAFGTAVLSVAAGRYLGSGPLGQQSLIAYVNGGISAVVVIALNTALCQLGGKLQGAGDRNALRRLLHWAIGAHLGAGAVVFAVMAAVGETYGHNRVSWLILGAVSVLDAATDALALRLILTEGWGPIGRLRLVFQLVGPLVGLGFLFGGLGIAGLFLGDGVAALALLIAALPRYRRLVAADPGERDGPRLTPPVPVLPTFVLFALAAVITQIVVKRIEFVVMAIFSTDRAIGQYSVAFMSVSLVSMVPLGIAAAAMPLIAAAAGRGENARADHHLRLTLRLGTALSIPVTALLAAVGPQAVILVYGTSYREAAALTALSALNLLVAVVGGVCTQFWSGRGRLGLVLRAGAAAGAVDLAVAFALIPHFAVLGAVIANLAGQASLAVALLMATVRNSGRIGWRIQGLLRPTIAGGAGALAAAVVVAVIDRWLPFGPELRSLLALVFGGALGVAVTVVTARVVKLFDGDERQWLGTMLPSRLTAPLGRFVYETRG